MSLYQEIQRQLDDLDGEDDAAEKLFRKTAAEFEEAVRSSLGAPAGVLKIVADTIKPDFIGHRKVVRYGFDTAVPGTFKLQLTLPRSVPSFGDSIVAEASISVVVDEESGRGTVKVNSQVVSHSVRPLAIEPAVGAVVKALREDLLDKRQRSTVA
ncbi:hypothetical protein [Chitinasiproducens palmae]|uniref:Uncharacterized protein n=1 Tax=Chitinasiproducens palmae TaxID=1770053 RepID=A0A1H2PS70_9BURK|nr:hypothetical protein [Chitinasiproducens palmae]SDV49805.1 hypothetical protein SAMN05216551_109151 [Chitinasiproducens palmae]